MPKVKPKILFVGFAVADLIDGKPYLGGAAGSMSINSAALGINPSLFAPLSKDTYGQLYQRALDKAKVDYHFCDFSSPYLPTCTINDRLGLGSTRDWQDNGALSYFLQMPIPEDLDKQFDSIFLCNAWKEVGEKIATSINSRSILYIPGPKIINNPDWISTKILEKTLILFCNEEEDSNVWKTNPFDHGVKIVVATGGKNGGKVYLADGQIIPYNAIPVENVIDPTGAGDSWALGFATQWWIG